MKLILNKLLWILILGFVAFLSVIVSSDLIFHFIGGFGIFQYSEIFSHKETVVCIICISLICAVVGSLYKSIYEKFFATITLAVSIAVFFTFQFAVAAHC